jgi:hypothetical protein
MNTKKRIAPFFVLATMMTLAACGSAKPSLKEFKLPGCGLTMQLPNQPKHETRTANAAGAPLKITLYTTTAGNSAYVVSCNDFPTDQVAAANLGRLLDSVGEGAMSNIGATMDSQVAIELNGHPGRDIVGRAKIAGQDAVVRARVYLVGNRMIQTLVMGAKGQMSDEDMTNYLSSLKLL